MAVEALSGVWAKEWKKQLDASPGFAAAAAGWSGKVVFAMRPDSGGDIERAVLLTIHNGRCHGARPARPADRAGCDLLLSASVDTWQRLLAGHADPVLAILLGHIRFEKGRWSDLMPYAQAARELLRAAAAVKTSFPTL